ncbi:MULTISPECIES: DUF6515 family protein [unclassified Pseudomonas]|uniref:DUF6515 family protein n=1 Tax=unclassified Pseudomonas TaxID=196821 RepID=UPI000CD14E13|nr:MULTISPECIES: DUF6515 family protein [unclassified Pseudomonas]POA50664.1 glycine zipper family protein [Pseudomonas sp. FW507-12TSA]
MKSRIWRMAGVGVLCVSVSAQVFADERDERRPPQQGEQAGGQREHAPEGRRESNQGHPAYQQPAPQQPRMQNEIIRGDNSRQFERSPQHQDGQWQERPRHEAEQQGRPAPQPAANLPIQPRPDTVRQTQEPQRGYYQDIPRRNDYNPHWQAGNPGWRPDNRHPNDNRWPGRPDGRGNGWGPGPQYRPGYVIDRFPERNFRVPYRGHDYFFSGGYWYRPQGSRYVVVTPPYGIRVGYLPDYAREVWIGSALFFLAAGAYYTYEANTQQYVVVEPPAGVVPPAPQPVGNGYDVLAYPVNGQPPQQVDQDRYDCYRWAVQQSGFDPASVTYQPAPEVVQAYRQAQGNCLSSRGYQVTY